MLGMGLLKRTHWPPLTVGYGRGADVACHPGMRFDLCCDALALLRAHSRLFSGGIGDALLALSQPPGGAPRPQATQRPAGRHGVYAEDSWLVVGVPRA